MPLQAQWLPQAQRVTAVQGLTDNRVTALAIDSTGFVWIGTTYGLNRFDGFSVKSFVPSSITSISNEIINDLEADAKGNLWVATHGGGLNRLNLKTLEWSVIKKPMAETKTGFISPVIWDIAADPDGTIWIANDGAFFVKYEPDKEKFTYYNFGEFIKKTIPPNKASSYFSINKCLRKDANHWWLGFNKGLALLNTSTGNFTLLGKGFDENITQMVWSELHQKIFITLENGNLYSYHEPTGTFKAETILPFIKSERLVSSQNSHSKHFIASPKGLLQFGTHHAGVSKSQYAFFENRILDSIPVKCYLPTKDHNLFVGTYEGLYYFSTNFSGNHYLPLYPLQAGPNANGTTSVLSLDSLGLIFATSSSTASLFVISEKEGWVKQLNLDANGIPLSACLKVKYIGEDIWVLTTRNIYKYHQKMHKLIPWKPAGSLKNAFYRDIAFDNQNQIWIAGFTSGVSCWNTNSEKWTTPTAPNKNGATSLVWDEKAKRMWVGYFGRGLHSYHENSAKNIFFNEGSRPSLQATMDLVNEITISDDESLWVASHTGGIFRFTDQAGDSIHYRRQHMLSGSTTNQYKAITPGTKGHVFAMHNRGIVSIDRHFNEYSLPFNPASFALYSDPVWPHTMHFRQESKQLLVPVQGGILSIPTKEANVTSFPIKIQVQPSVIKDNNYSIYNNSNILTLNYNHNVVQFLVSALYFGTTPLRFEYTLNQKENTWQTLHDMPYLRFDQLASGSYSLMVRATTSNGQIVAQSDVFYITVETPFWKSEWFIICIIFLITIAIFYIIKKMQGKIADEQILNQFSTRLYGTHSLDDILWDAAESINQLMGFEDCIIYELNTSQQMLIQRTAAGPKRPYHSREILNPIEIKVGKGITGTVAMTGKPERIGNTSRDPRYIVDDAPRFSELTVPIFIDGAVFGVIDTEHPNKHFYTHSQQKLLEKMTTILADRIKKYVTEEKLRNKIARDLHDDIGSTLSSISVISKVAQAQPDLSEKARQAMQNIHLRTSEVLENMSDIVWMINPANDDPAMLVDKMREWLAEWVEPAGISHSFETNDYSIQFAFNMEERKNCYLIFKEAVNNAVKYSDCSHITVSVQLLDDHLKIKIIDNGKGFDKQKTSSGNGLNNMQQRAKAIGASLQIISALSKGTTIELVKQVALLG